VAEVLRVVPGCEIDLDELEWKFTASGGPGGQHANRSNTRVELTFDVAGSPSLTEEQRALLVSRLGEVVRIVADDERSQARNRTLALDRLRSRLADALHVPRPRRPTKKSRSAQERRLQGKREQSERKAGRRSVSREDY
jgi:ribosome-associated protein